MTLGERIKVCRQQAGMSQEKVAELIGISRQAVTKWETNQSAPSTDNLFKLAEIFGTTVDLLLPDTEEDKKAAFAAPAEPQKISKPTIAIIFIVIAAILLFLVWQAGQNIGEDIGEFLFYLNKK